MSTDMEQGPALRCTLTLKDAGLNQGIALEIGRSKGKRETGGQG